jgi:hypothetical protein
MLRRRRPETCPNTPAQSETPHAEVPVITFPENNKLKKLAVTSRSITMLFDAGDAPNVPMVSARIEKRILLNTGRS